MKKLFDIISTKSRQFIYDEQGATAIEYALIATLIGVALIGGMKAFGSAFSDYWNNLANSVAEGMGNTG